MKLIFSLFVSLLYITQYGKPFKLHDFDKPTENLKTDSTVFPVQVLQENFIKSLVDRASYRLIRLGNGIEILLISEPNSNKASVSVDVGIGSLHDPVSFLVFLFYEEPYNILGRLSRNGSFLWTFAFYGYKKSI